MVSSDPTRWISCDSSTRSSFTWPDSGSSPISSRKMVPPSALSNFPFRSPVAPVNAPFRCPNSSDSSRLSGIAPQLTEMYGLSALAPFAWITFAISSLPVPLSPSMSTGRSVGAAFSAISSASRRLALSPNVPSKTKLRSSRALRRAPGD